MDKKLFIHLQGGRKVSGTLRGFDIFLNLVIDDAVEETVAAQKHSIGQVVSVSILLWWKFGSDIIVFVGNSWQQCDLHGNFRSNTVTVGKFNYIFTILKFEGPNTPLNLWLLHVLVGGPEY